MMKRTGLPAWVYKLPTSEATWEEISAFSKKFDGFAWAEGSPDKLAQAAAEVWDSWHYQKKLPFDDDKIRACLWLHAQQREDIADDAVADAIILDYLQDLLDGLHLLALIKFSVN